MKVRHPPFSLAAAGLVLAAFSALAHETNGIVDLSAIDARVDAQLDATKGPEHRAYAKVANAIQRKSRPSRGIADDVVKLLAVAHACHGRLSDDADLVAALPAAESQVESYLADEPDDVALASHRLERARDRTQLAAMLDAVAKARAEAAERRNASDEIGMLKKYQVAGARLAKAANLLRTLIAKQVRRGSPGQPLKKGPKGTIDVFAGNGQGGFVGDGGNPLDAELALPVDVAVEPSTGLVYIDDFNNYRIRRIDADGKLRTVAGVGELGDVPGPALQAKLHHASGITFHPVTGDLYIAGWHVHRVLRLVMATATIERYAGTGEPGDAGDGGWVWTAVFNYPSSIAFDAAGGWYVSDQNNQRVRYVDTAETIHAFAGTGVAGFSGDDAPAVDAQLSQPDGDRDSPAGRCCLDPSERFLYVCDTSNHRVRRVEIATKIITTVAGNGTAGYAGDGGPAKDAELNAPVDVDCDDQGNLYVCDRDANVVRRVDASTGTISTFAGTGVAGLPLNGVPATSSRLKSPQGIFVDRVRGRVYIADTQNDVIRAVWE